MRMILALLIGAALYAQVPEQDSRNTEHPEHRHSLHSADLQDAGRVGGAARRICASRFSPPPACCRCRRRTICIRRSSAASRTGLLHREGAARNAARLLSRRQSLPAAEAAARRRLPGDRSRRTATGTTAGWNIPRSPPSRRAASISRGRATWCSATTWWATTTPSRRRTISAIRASSSGISGRSACNCGTPSARWISCSRSPA